MLNTYLVYYNIKKQLVTVADEVTAEQKHFDEIEIRVPSKVIAKGSGFAPRCWVEAIGTLKIHKGKALIV